MITKDDALKLVGFEKQKKAETDRLKRMERLKEFESRLDEWIVTSLSTNSLTIPPYAFTGFSTRDPDVKELLDTYGKNGFYVTAQDVGEDILVKISIPEEPRYNAGMFLETLQELQEASMDFPAGVETRHSGITTPEGHFAVTDKFNLTINVKENGGASILTERVEFAPEDIWKKE